jgi:hypothetical protein
MAMTTAAAADGTAPARATAGEVLACRECGTVHCLPAMPDDTVARCVACAAKLYIRFEGTVERTLALYLAALVLFLVANAFPVMSMAIAGQSNASTILDSEGARGVTARRPVSARLGRNAGAAAILATSARKDPLKAWWMIHGSVVGSRRLSTVRKPRWEAPSPSSCGWRADGR